MTFVAFGAIFATMGLGAVKGRSILTVDLVAGVVAGAALWWSMLVLAVYALRRHFSYEKLVWVNRGAGAFVIVVGLLYMFVLHGASVEPRSRRLFVVSPAAPKETRRKSPGPPPWPAIHNL